MKQKSRELGDAAKDSAHNKLHQGQDKVDEYRVRAVQLSKLSYTSEANRSQASGKEKLEMTRQEAERAKDDAKSRVAGARRDVKSTVSEYGHDAQRKFDEYKTSASNTLVDARDGTERKLEEAKATGSSWFGWGSDKADETRKGGVEKVKEGAENVKQKADKYS